MQEPKGPLKEGQQGNTGHYFGRDQRKIEAGPKAPARRASTFRTRRRFRWPVATTDATTAMMRLLTSPSLVAGH